MSSGRTEDDAIAAELAAEDRDLGLEEPDAGIATCREALEEEVQDHVEPLGHDG
jgi:hypothetical protein